LEANRKRFAKSSSARQAQARSELVEQQKHALFLSQAGQDYWVYGSVFNEKTGGFFVDVGAHDGLYLSNTYILEKRYGWNGILIEANPMTFGALRANRNAECVNACVSSEKETVTFECNSTFGGIVADDCDAKGVANSSKLVEMETVTLESILVAANAPQTIDYLSIDIEGAEDRALLKFPFDKYIFTSITIERPSLQLRNLLASHDYVLVAEIPGLDCFYIHKSHQDRYFDNILKFHGKPIAFAVNTAIKSI
jgi:FkbM family methyltransferase